METTAAAVGLIVGLVAIWISERARRRSARAERAVLELVSENKKVLEENFQLRNRMYIQKSRLRNVEIEVASWRGSLETCAQEHFSLSEKLHDLSATDD